MKYKVGDRAEWSIGGNWWHGVTIMGVKPDGFNKGFDYEILADDGGILEGEYEGARESELRDFADAND
jgi:hypothetical protein